MKLRATVMQQTTQRPVQVELTTDVRTSLLAWFGHRGGKVDEDAFPSRIDRDEPLSTRQYARLLDKRVTAIGLSKGNSMRIWIDA